MASRTTWWAGIAGAVVGLCLGLAVGYFGRYPVFGSGDFGSIVYPLAIGLAVVIGILVWMAIRRSQAAVGALAALLVFGFVGVVIAPTPPGGFTSGSGSVSIGTTSQPTAYYEGSARCEYTVGGLYVNDIRGFAWTVKDPALYEALDLAGTATVTNVHLGTGAMPIGSEAYVEFAAGQSARSGSFVAFALTSVAPDGTSGTAVSKDKAVVITWTCASGPRG